MSNTREELLSNGSYLKIASGPEKGYVSNEGSSNFLIKEDSDSSPDHTEVIGHTVSARDEIGFTYDITTGQAIYCYTTFDSVKATVTSFT